MSHKNTYMTLALALSAMLTVSGCATSAKSSLNKLVTSTPSNDIVLPVNYLDAYANTKAYYNKCVAQAGVSYPNTVTTNGVTVTTMAKTPDTTISSNLDRANQTASIAVFIGSKAQQHITFQPKDANTTVVRYYGSKAGLRSKEHNDKMLAKRLTTLKTVSQSQPSQCL